LEPFIGLITNLHDKKKTRIVTTAFLEDDVPLVPSADRDAVVEVGAAHLVDLLLREIEYFLKDIMKFFSVKMTNLT